MKAHFLNKIFKENLNFLPKWHGALANHTSMAATAMFLMSEYGCFDERGIKKQADNYMQNLTPNRINQSLIDLGGLDWTMQQSLLGRDDFYESWKSYFINELSSNDHKVVIALWLERLGVGVSAAAGHSLIRLAYGLMAEPYLERKVFIEEVAVCLSDYCSRYLALSENKPDISTRKTSLSQYILQGSDLSSKNREILNSCSLIEDKYFICRNFSEFKQATMSVNVMFDFEKVLENIVSISIVNPDFALLHCITLAHAVLYLTDVLPAFEQRPLYQGYRDYVIAALLCQNLKMQKFEKQSISINNLWQKISDLENTHSQKIAFSLIELSKRYDSPLYLQSVVSFINK